jgi:hypothetical protein
VQNSRSLPTISSTILVVGGDMPIPMLIDEVARIEKFIFDKKRKHIVRQTN